MSVVKGHADTSLAHRTRLAVLWNTGILTLISIGQFGVMLVMVRLLSPEVYGQYGLLMAIIGFLYVFSAQNFVDYTLQVRLEADVHYQDIFTTSVGVNFLLFLITNVVAICTVLLPNYSSIQTPLHWLSLGFLLQPGRAVRIAMLKRALDWKRIRVLHAIGLILSTVISLPLAYHGAGIYALLIPTFIVPLPFLYDIFYRCQWRPSWSWDHDRLKPALKFGANRQVCGLIVSGRRLLESSAIVGALGFAGFGVFGRAVGLAELACNRLLSHAVEALYPSLTKLEPKSERFRRVSGVVLRTCAWLTVPIAALIGQLATPIVRLIYGEKWLEVIPLVGWSVAIAAAGAIYFTLYRLLLAHDQQRHCLWTDVMLFTGTALSLFILLPSGLISYMQGLFGAQLVLILAAALFLISGKGIDVGAVIQALVAPLIGSLGASCVFVDSIAGVLGNETAYSTVTLQIILFMAIYTMVIRTLFPQPLREIVSYLPRRQVFNNMLFLG